MLTVVTLLKRHHVRFGEGDRPFWTTRGGEYLAKLVAGVRRWIGDVPIVCLTDSPELIPDGVRPVPLARPADPSWWNKLQQFAPETGLAGRCLYLDLDNVLAGPLGALTSLTPAPLIMTDDERVPGLPNASTLLYDAAGMHDTWAAYLAEPEAVQARHATWPHAADQGFLAARFPGVPLFQRLVPGLLRNGRLLEDGAPWTPTPALVFGCSTPKPHESRHPFFRQHWHGVAA
jgi:hypothetical protein